jgi:hypothetical protein
LHDGGNEGTNKDKILTWGVLCFCQK